MAASTTVNGRTVVHRTSGGSLATFPDVCLTPSPGGPVPVPYPNLARSVDLADGTRTVAVDGSPIAVEDSVFSRSTGDEPGTQKGVLSRAVMGEARFLNWSFDVKVEGKGACRLFDPMASNGGSPTNTMFAAEVQPPLRVPPGRGPRLTQRHLVEVVFQYRYRDADRPTGAPRFLSIQTPLRFTGPEGRTIGREGVGYPGVRFTTESEGDYTVAFDAFDLRPRALLPRRPRSQ